MISLSTVVRDVNILGDDNVSIQNVTSWVNDAIAAINAELGANFPFIDPSQGEGSFVFDEKWVRTCVIPYATARLKQMDSSTQESSRLYQQFNDGLALMKFSYEVPEQFKDMSDPRNSGDAQSDIYMTPSMTHLGWW